MSFSSSGLLRLELVVSENMRRLIKGHFPSRVIWPGAMIMVMVEGALVQWFSSEMNEYIKLCEMTNVRFFSVVESDVEMWIEIEIVEESKSFFISHCRVKSAEQDILQLIAKVCRQYKESTKEVSNDQVNGGNF
ncbi:hypothetical protein [Bacillus cereus]|uniref:hypothetical protein n=1 Tax=Bacillus cereus TaxID=1396 RepID=UPI00065C0523|nr:hypothetical protein [Bacillus cereus]KMQ32180.1 hypothetical protein TU58_01455 [Bacillus cereus]